MSRRKQLRVSRELQDAAAERWRERLEADAKPTKPPAPAWRSMASAPRDGTWILAKFESDAFVAVRWEERRVIWVSRMGIVFFDFELAAWAPIPEWTGEVAE